MYVCLCCVQQYTVKNASHSERQRERKGERKEKDSFHAREQDNKFQI